MNFYRDFCRERMKEVEEALTDVGDMLEVENDDDINAQQALSKLAIMAANSNLASATLTTMAAGRVYKIGQTYMQIDAVDREDYAVDAEGLALAVVNGQDDGYKNFNPAPIGIGHGYSHPAYPRIVSRIPIKNIYRLGPPGLFNGCLFHGQKNVLFSCRTKGFPSSTLLYHPKEDFLFERPKQLVLPESFEYCSLEDMRMLTHRGATLGSFTLAGQTKSGWICQILLGEINDQREFSWVHALESPVKADVEKNWVFFTNNDCLFCVYYPSPHIVYQVEWSGGAPRLGERWEAENWQSADLLENARGGASPHRVGTEYYHFYHSQHRHGRGVSYQVGLYTFEAKPPWNIKRQIKGPLLSLVPSKRDLDCIFPTGAAIEGGRWRISCGIQDHETVALTLEIEDVERLLTKV